MREHDGTDEVAAARHRRDVAVILAPGVLRQVEAQCARRCGRLTPGEHRRKDAEP